MNGSLGIYVGEKIVKYAALSMDQEKRIGVESVGTKFISTNKEDTIKEILRETESNYPISFNLKNETYENISLISKLSKSDMAKVIEIEFEDLCEKKGTNPKLFDKRYMVTEENETGENNILLVRATKAQVEDIKNSAKGHSVGGIYPGQINIVNLVPPSESNYIVLNLEEQTQIITVIKGAIVKLSSLNLGLSTILEKLSYELNSDTKAYEICKSLNVYGDSSTSVAPEYERIIEPILQDIIHRFEAQIIEYKNDIKKIYITGIGQMFANLDRLFEEYFQIKTELLKPHFLSPASMAADLGGILEANSAIALAYELLEPTDKKVLNFTETHGAGLEDIKDKMKGIFGGAKAKSAAKPAAKPATPAVPATPVAAIPMQQTVDLTPKSVFEDVPDDVPMQQPVTPQPQPAPITREMSEEEELAATVAKMTSQDIAGSAPVAPVTNNIAKAAPSATEETEMQDIINEEKHKGKKSSNGSVIDKFRTAVINLSVVAACAAVTYIAVGVFFDTQIMSAKEVYLSKVKDVNANIAQINQDLDYVGQTTAEYEIINQYVDANVNLIQNEEIGKFTTNNVAKFLRELMNIMPRNVVLTKITSDENKKIVITADSSTYADLGYLISRIKLDGTLENLKIKEIVHAGKLSIEIGGDLP